MDLILIFVILLYIIWKNIWILYNLDILDFVYIQVYHR